MVVPKKRGKVWYYYWKIRGETSIWDILSGSFFENSTNRQRYVSKMQEWQDAYSIENGGDDYDSVITTNLIAYQDGGLYDIDRLKIYLNDELVADIRYTKSKNLNISYFFLNDKQFEQL